MHVFIWFYLYLCDDTSDSTPESRISAPFDPTAAAMSQVRNEFLGHAFPAISTVTECNKYTLMPNRLT
uniref:Secreted protein n=1 Tax=Panagrellus redivivus TaxID=6233 RepID=A0A7E4WDU9_PANRE